MITATSIAPAKSLEESAGERLACDIIFDAERRYISIAARIEELEHWLSTLAAYPGSSAFARPLIEAEIERLTR